MIQNTLFVDQMTRNTIHNVTDINLMKIGCEDASAIVTDTAEDIRVEDEGANAEGNNLRYGRQDLDLVNGCQDTNAEAAHLK